MSLWRLEGSEVLEEFVCENDGWIVDVHAFIQSLEER